MSVAFSAFRGSPFELDSCAVPLGFNPFEYVDDYPGTRKPEETY